MNKMPNISGEMLIVLIICILVLALFFALVITTFFVVKIKGALEEKDSEYDLLKLGLIKYQKGNWVINIGDLFNEYAALKIDFGWTFRVLFEGWELFGNVSGDKCGTVRGVVSRNTVLVRRKIRRK